MTHVKLALVAMLHLLCNDYAITTQNYLQNQNRAGFSLFAVRFWWLAGESCVRWQSQLSSYTADPAWYCHCCEILNGLAPSNGLPVRLKALTAHIYPHHLQKHTDIRASSLTVGSNTVNKNGRCSNLMAMSLRPPLMRALQMFPLLESSHIVSLLVLIPHPYLS